MVRLGLRQAVSLERIREQRPYMRPWPVSKSATGGKGRSTRRLEGWGRRRERGPRVGFSEDGRLEGTGRQALVFRVGIALDVLKGSWFSQESGKVGSPPRR